MSAQKHNLIYSTASNRHTSTKSCFAMRSMHRRACVASARARPERYDRLLAWMPGSHSRDTPSPHMGASPYTVLQNYELCGSLANTGAEPYTH